MRKYFTKYLPVEGEVQEGGKFLHTKTGLIETAIHVHGPHTHPHKPVKLFLCSRDIQVGDKYFNTDYNLYRTALKFAATSPDLVYFDESTVFDYREDCIKVVGEVSPDAVWVTEGMEFDETDLALMNQANLPTPITDGVNLHSNPHVKDLLSSGTFKIGIRCPTCKTFH